MATLVSRVTREVAVAASTNGMKESWAVSLEEMPSYPIDSAHAASAGMAANSLELKR